MAAPIVGENSIGIRLAWRSFQAAIRRSASFKHLGVGRAPLGRFFLGGLPALILHLAAVEAHVRNRVRSRAGVESEKRRIAVNVAKPGDLITLFCQQLTHL